jgi:hypothetical protein
VVINDEREKKTKKKKKKTTKKKKKKEIMMMIMEITQMMHALFHAHANLGGSILRISDRVGRWSVARKYRRKEVMVSKEMMVDPALMGDHNSRRIPIDDPSLMIMAREWK